MAVDNRTISFRTEGHGSVVNITDLVQSALEDTGLLEDVCVIFSPSATSALTTLEYEEGCVQDLKRVFDELVPESRDYQHNLRWGDGNGHSHIRAALFKPSLSVPFQNARLTLGMWQQIVFLDFDNRQRKRKLVIQLIGE